MMPSLRRQLDALCSQDWAIDESGVRRSDPEALLFEFDEAGEIERVDVYIEQSPPGDATE